MTTEVVQGVQTVTPASRPYLALGLTFLLVGVGFAGPWTLVPQAPSGMWEGAFSRETLNLYALVDFLGLSHFCFAWRGQWQAVRRLGGAAQRGYWGLIGTVLGALLLGRSVLGVAIFSLLVWVWNIGHLIKTEAYFAGERGRVSSPVIAFGYFSLVLFLPGAPRHQGWVLLVTLMLAAGLLLTGDWRTLSAGVYRLPLLSLLFLGEALVWNGYGPYMSPAFRVGVYVFHIAAASFFHYLSSYFWARARGSRAPLTWWSILLVNLVVIGLGVAVGRVGALRWASLVFAPVWFTVWVALHLAGSDLLPWWRRRASLPAEQGVVASATGGR